MGRSAVATTKVTPPQPPTRYLRRSRLVDALEESVESGRGVVLVSAPAGAGKTTLLTGWLDTADRAIGWVQLDSGDDDPARLWPHVATALPIDDASPDDIAAAIERGPIATAEWVARAASDHQGGIALVLDDYHLITNPDVHDTVQRLIELRPANLTVVISTRFDPPLRLGRLRVSGHLTEMRAADLRFDVDEAGWLLDADANGLPIDAVEKLHARTEGWAAGLVLAGLSMRDGDGPSGEVGSFRGDDMLVTEYLTEELLDALSDADRDRLLEISVLERMSGPLVDAVTGSTSGDKWLRNVAASNQLVIALDRTGTWFRLHHLLRDLLRAELARRAPQRLADLHAAAAGWYHAAGETADAIEHHVAAGNEYDAADLIAAYGAELLNNGQAYTLARYLDRVPELVGEHVGVTVVYGWLALATGRHDDARRTLAELQQLDTSHVDPGLLHGMAVNVHLADGDIASALLAVSDDPETTTEPGSALASGAALVWAGRYDEALAHLERAKTLGAEASAPFDIVVSQAFEAIIAIESAQRRSALDLARAAIEAADIAGLTDLPHTAPAHSVLARVTSDPTEAVAAGLRGVELWDRSRGRVTLLYVLASAADVAFVAGHDDADSLLAEARAVADRCVDPGIAGRYLRQVEARHGHADRPTTSLVEEVSERELAVLRYLPSTLSQREIASELFVSVNTVKTHCRAIYRKLGVDGRTAAVQAARDHGLL